MKCEVKIPPLELNKENLLIVTMKNTDGNPFGYGKEKLKVSAENLHLHKITDIPLISEVSFGIYQVSFTPDKCGEYLISAQVDRNHFKDSPYRFVCLYLCYICIIFNPIV